MPMLLWNAGHDWVTLAKQFGRLTHHGFDPRGLFNFLLTQFGILNPLVAVFAGVGVVIALRGRPAPRAGDMALLLWTVLPLVAYIGVHAFQEQIQGHWLAPIFPTLALVAAVAAETTVPRWPAASLVLPVGIGGMIIGLVAALNPGNAIPMRLDVGQGIRGWDGSPPRPKSCASSPARRGSPRPITASTASSPTTSPPAACRSSPSKGASAMPMHRRPIRRFSTSRSWSSLVRASGSTAASST